MWSNWICAPFVFRVCTGIFQFHMRNVSLKMKMEVKKRKTTNDDDDDENNNNNVMPQIVIIVTELD